MTQKLKDPAATAIANRVGVQPTPTKDQEMNKGTHSTSDAETPVHSLTQSALAACSLRHLRGVYDALRGAEMTLGGIINQPRFSISKTNTLNPAGNLVDDLHTHTLNMIDALIRHVGGRPTSSVEDVESKAWILLSYESYCSDDLPRFVVMAAEQAVALSSAEFDEKMARRAS